MKEFKIEEIIRKKIVKEKSIYFSEKIDGSIFKKTIEQRLPDYVDADNFRNFIEGLEINPKKPLSVSGTKVVVKISQCGNPPPLVIEDDFSSIYSFDDNLFVNGQNKIQLPWNLIRKIEIFKDENKIVINT